MPAALEALAQNATNPLVRAVLEDGIDRLKRIIQEGATPEFMHELADLLDKEAAVLTLCDEQGGDRISKLVCGLAYVLGIPYDNNRRVPLLKPKRSDARTCPGGALSSESVPPASRGATVTSRSRHTDDYALAWRHREH